MSTETYTIQDVYDYLDTLREEGQTNMFWCEREIMQRFDIAYTDASVLLVGWWIITEEKEQ